MPSLQQWLWLIVIILSTGTQVTLSSSDEVTTPATQVPQVEVHGPRDLVCFLRRRPMDGCSNKNADLIPGSGIPARIQDIYSKMRSSLRAFIAQGSLASAAPQLFSELHPVIFYLMPHGDDRLRAGGEALARYVRGRGGESAAISVATALLDDVDDRDIFISKLAGVLLPERSQSLLGEHLVKWFPGTDDWKFERFGKVLKAGNPLVGSLPSPFLTSLPSDTIERFLFLLSQWETLGSTKGDQWFSKGKAVARTWSLMVIKSQQPHHLSRWKSLSYHRYSFLLLGFTPDELLKMSNPGSEVWSDIFQLKFDRLQARAVFQAMVGNGSSLKEGDLKNGIPLFSTPLLPLLSPFQLAGSFNHSVADFGALNYLPGKRFENPSFATALQLSHCLIAQCMHAKMSNSSVKGNGRTSEIVDAILISDWASSAGKEHLPLECFIHAGQFAYSLPLPLFRNQNISKIDPKLLKDTDSDELSILQGRLLTRHLIIHLEDDEKQPLNQITNGSFLVGADDLMAFGPGLLRGILPTSSITSLNVHEVPQKVIQHLLDVDNPWHLSHEEELSLRSLAILQKLGDELSESWVLKHILASESPVQILRYLPPQQLKDLSKDIVSNSNVITLSALHHSTLSTLLDVAMPELLMRGPGGGKWSLEALTLRAMPLLRGMDCRHLLLVDPHDVVVVLGQYNKQRQDKGRVKYQPFPKNLQNCAIRALASHLELKAALWSGANVTNLSSVDVMQAFEASDAESVGGYVIAGLPERVLEYLGADALRLVGQLNPQELLMALYGKHHPSDIALILLKQLGMASDMEVVEALEGLRGVPKYSVGRLGSRWLEWSGRRAAASLIPLLFGSLLQFLPPDIVDPASLKWTLESASPEGKLVCMGTKQRQSWYSTLVQAFGPPEKWTSSTVGGLGDFLLVVPEESLGHIAKDSWAEAIDTLVENTRYFTRNMQTPSGFLSYYEVCAKTLPKAEEEAYVSAVKRLARFMLEAMQWHLDSVTPYGKIIFGQRSNGSSPGGIGEETVVHVPGLRRPSLKSTVAPPHLPLSSSGRTTREGKERKAEEQPHSVKGTATEVSCSAIRAVSPELVALALKPEDIKLMTSQEMGDCVDTLGLAPLERDVLRVVWEKAKESDLPLELEDLGKVVSVMPLEDLLAFNVTVSSNLDAVSTLGREISNWELVDALALHVMPRGGRGEALGVEAAAAMGALLCGLPPEKLPRPQVMFRVAPLVSQSLVSGLRGGRGCPPLPCLRALASAASSWLGKPVGKDGWTAMELSFLGVLAAGLEEGTLQSLAVSDGADKGKHTLRGLDISSLECMPEYILKNLSGMFVSQLSQLAAMRLMEEAEGVLTEDATSALKGVEQSPFDRMVFLEKGGVEGAKDGSEMKVEESTSEGVIAGGAAVTTAGGVALFWSGALLVAVAQMVL